MKIFLVATATALIASASANAGTLLTPVFSTQPTGPIVTPTTTPNLVLNPKFVVCMVANIFGGSNDCGPTAVVDPVVTNMVKPGVEICYDPNGCGGSIAPE